MGNLQRLSPCGRVHNKFMVVEKYGSYVFKVVIMLLTKQVEITWNKINRKKYVGLGYQFTDFGDRFLLNIKDLALGSHIYVDVQCDYCGKKVRKTYQTYNKQHHPIFGDACRDCQPQKNKLVCLEKYGVDNGSKTQEAIEKIKQTSMERYGVDNPSKSVQARRKISQKSKANATDRMAKAKATSLERYGCEHPMKLSEVQERQKNTMLRNYGVDHPKKSEIVKERERKHNREKYGCDYYWQTDEAKEQIKQTNLEKYGYEYTLQVPEIRQRGFETMAKNGTCLTSKQQLEVYDMCVDIYGENNVTLNKPLASFMLDVAVNCNGCMVDVEYDGAYWHQDAQRDRRRDEVVKSYGYKVFRIVGGHNIPTKEQLSYYINKLAQGKHTFSTINLNT